MTLTTPTPGIATVEELRAYMNAGPFNQAQQFTAGLILVGVQQELEKYLNRPLQLVQVRELLSVDAMNFLNPSIAPIQKVIKFQVVDDGYGFQFDDFIDWTDFDQPYITDPQSPDPDLPENGRLVDNAPPVINAPRIMDNGLYLGDYRQYAMGTVFFVEYLGGYNGTVDVALKLDILRVAAREMAPNQDDSMNLRDGKEDTVNPSDMRGSGWTDAELAQWDRLRRRTVA